MRETERDPMRVQHMIEASNNVINFMKDKTLQDLENDKILFFAVVKNIEIIGEAAYKLTSDFKETHPNLPWNQIAGMRHVLVHEYFQISPLQIFKVYKDDIPYLLNQLTKI